MEKKNNENFAISEQTTMIANNNIYEAYTTPPMPLSTRNKLMLTA